MTPIVKAILTYTNPTKLDMLYLSNIIYRCNSIRDQVIYIASPSTNLLHYSSSRLENIKLTQALSKNEISHESIKEFNNEFAHFKVSLKKYNNF